MAQLPDDYKQKHDDCKQKHNIKNGFQCKECLNTHDIADLFLWSTCQHKYGRGCVVFAIRQQLYDKKLPLCIVDNCKKLLLENEAQLVLPQDVLMEYYQTHNDYQKPAQQIQLLDHDEKNSHPQYQSLKQSNADSSSDGMNDIIGTVNENPKDDSSEAEYTYDKTEQQPLLNNGHLNYGLTQNNINKPPFDCILCNNKHSNDYRFEWTQCKHLYGRQCAENMIIGWLFKREIPKCIKCKHGLELYDAVNVLQYDELEVFKEIYALKASLQSFNQQKQQIENDKDILSTQKPQSENENVPIASVSDQTEKQIINNNESELKEMKNESENHNNNKNNKLLPSVLMLPDNNYQTLIPMDDDFIDANGVILNAKKEAELTHQNLFYCSRCKKLISLTDSENNGKYVPTKCKHVSCKKCAQKHTKHELQILKFIPTCQVCTTTILDTDLVNIWGRQMAKQFMDTLFKEKSLKVPPAEPAVAALSQPITTMAAGAANNNNNDNNIENERENNERNVEQKCEENEIENKNNKNNNNNNNVSDEDGSGYCMTGSCHKKGLLSREKYEETRLDCVGCGISWCIQCGVEWHLGQTCKQYMDEINNNNDNIDIMYALQQQQAMQFDNNYDDIIDGYHDKNEQEFQKLYEKKGWKTCPVCLSAIEKEIGCNRVQCVCGVSFCWICQEIVDQNGNDKHYEIGKCQLNEQQQ